MQLIMKVDIKKLPKSEVQLVVTVPYSVYQKWEKKALEDISKNIKISGFRSGHIPEDVIRRNVGKDEIKAATLDFVLPQTYAEAVKEYNLQVISHPKVEIKSDIKKEGDDFVYAALVAVMPEVTVGNYRKIKVARKPVEVTKKNIQETIRMIMEKYAEWKEIDRKAKKGDRAEVGFEGFDENGQAIPNTASKNHPVVLGSNTMVPGFEDSIIGMIKGEIKECGITFPKDYHSKPLQGKTVKFKITLNRVEEKVEQKLDEEMVEKITGQKQSVGDFEKLVEADLKAEMEMRNRRDHDNAVTHEILKATKADIPEVLIDDEVAYMLEEQKGRLKEQGINWEQYLTHIKKTEDDFKKEHRKSAEERIIARLGVQYILKDAKIAVSDDELSARISEIIAQYPEKEQAKTKEYYKNTENTEHIRHNMAADKLINMLSA